MKTSGIKDSPPIPTEKNVHTVQQIADTLGISKQSVIRVIQNAVKEEGIPPRNFGRVKGFSATSDFAKKLYSDSEVALITRYAPKPAVRTALRGLKGRFEEHGLSFDDAFSATVQEVFSKVESMPTQDFRFSPDAEELLKAWDIETATLAQNTDHPGLKRFLQELPQLTRDRALTLHTLWQTQFKTPTPVMGVKPVQDAIRIMLDNLNREFPHLQK